ncbi:MAG: hypothetical protein K2H87_05015 [Duncaniella sp.]|nr:hypothetical protein [Duncaniella sp.]
MMTIPRKIGPITYSGDRPTFASVKVSLFSRVSSSSVMEDAELAERWANRSNDPWLSALFVSEMSQAVHMTTEGRPAESREMWISPPELPRVNVESSDLETDVEHPPTESEYRMELFSPWVLASDVVCVVRWALQEPKQ